MALFCVYCGAELEQDSSLCNACGKSQGNATDESGAAAKAVMARAVPKASPRLLHDKEAANPSGLHPEKKPATTLWKSLAPIIIGIVIVIIPAPAGLKFSAWCYFALFTAVLVGIIVEPIPSAAVGLLGVGLATVLGLVESKPGNSIKWALSGFSNTTVWLIFAAFMFAMGYEKTRLGRRIALGLVRVLGSKTLGLGYAITLADLILAPATPSNTARSGGTIFPVIRNIPALYGSYPGESARKIGSYLMWTALASTCITGAMFTTSLATNTLTVELIRKIVKVDVSWTQWFIGFLPMGVLLIATIPYLIYKIYPPEIKASKEVPAWATKELEKMGKISGKEIGLAILVALALIMWIFGTSLVDTTTVAIMVVGLMVATRIVTWDDILEYKAGWNILVWFATLVSLADGLNRVGFVSWFANLAASHLVGVSPVVIMVVLVALYYFSHYMFANLTSHAIGVMPVILAAGAAIPGMPIRTFALLLCYSVALQGAMTPYACGSAPVYFASGFIPRKDFWVMGLLFSVVFLGTLLVIGIPYLTAISH